MCIEKGIEIRLAITDIAPDPDADRANIPFTHSLEFGERDTQVHCRLAFIEERRVNVRIGHKKPPVCSLGGFRPE
jgi:hypothetical protein